MRELIFLCLRHWVLNYHVDGFRFDLASVLNRDRNGDWFPIRRWWNRLPKIHCWPIPRSLPKRGTPPGRTRLARSPACAGPNGTAAIATTCVVIGAATRGRSATLPRVYPARAIIRPFRQPYHSINFVTSHDGFTLNDLVTYMRKHNEVNGEDNRDGDNNNYSDNYGIEGPTNRRAVERIRTRQLRNFLATLFLSQGVPMLLYGDECRRTQCGNNNAYCQDNDIAWFDWDLVHRNVDLVRFTQALINFRKRQATLRTIELLERRACRARHAARRQLVQCRGRGRRMGYRRPESDMPAGRPSDGEQRRAASACAVDVSRRHSAARIFSSAAGATDQMEPVRQHGR